jgi:hypothetical protein
MQTNQNTDRSQVVFAVNRQLASLKNNLKCQFESICRKEIADHFRDSVQW